MKKNKLIIVDLDGTLVNTSKINFYSYKKAMNEFGYDIEFDFFQEYCNGRNYKDFLTEIIGAKEEVIDKIHHMKKKYYKDNIKNGKLNEFLKDILLNMKQEYNIALVTNASKQNTIELLEEFKIVSIFDLIITQEEMINKKPSPEGFLKAMQYFDILPKDTLIFEDSYEGETAAIASGAKYVLVKGYR